MVNLNIDFDINGKLFYVEKTVEDSNTAILIDVLKNIFEEHDIELDSFVFYTHNDMRITDEILQLCVSDYVLKYGKHIILVSNRFANSDYGSFDKDTVLTGVNGKEIKIKNVNTGDFLLNYNTRTKRWVRVKVDAVHCNVMRSEYIINNTLRVNDNQEVFVHSSRSRNNWKLPRDLKIGDKIKNIDGKYNKIHNITHNSEAWRVGYNLTTSPLNNFFANGILVHNQDEDVDYTPKDGDNPSDIGAVNVVSLRNTKPYRKFFGVDIFDVMNPEKAYPLIIKVSNHSLEKHITMENVLTGERKTHKVKEEAFHLKHGQVKVQPVFPGCLVVPSLRYTNFDKEEDELEFNITPIINDNITAYIDLIQDADVFHTMEFSVSIKDPRVAKATASYGIMTSFTPKILDFLDIPIDFFDRNLGGISIPLTTLIALVGTGIAVLVGVIRYFSLKGSKSGSTLSFSAMQRKLQEERSNDRMKKKSKEKIELEESPKRKSKAKVMKRAGGKVMKSDSLFENMDEIKGLSDTSEEEWEEEDEEEMEDDFGMMADMDVSSSEDMSSPPEEIFMNASIDAPMDEREMRKDKVADVSPITAPASHVLSEPNFRSSIPPPVPQPNPTPEAKPKAYSSPAKKIGASPLRRPGASGGSPPIPPSGSHAGPPSGPPGAGAPPSKSDGGMVMNELREIIAKKKDAKSELKPIIEKTAIVEEEVEDITHKSPLMDSLDAAFVEWEKKELSKEGKI